MTKRADESCDAAHETPPERVSRSTLEQPRHEPGGTVTDNDANMRFMRDATDTPLALTKAYKDAHELGITTVDPMIGTQIAVLAAAAAAENIIEIGTGAGVSGLWMLQGAPGSTLTSIDTEPEHLAAARDAFATADVPASRVRLIRGQALDVLPRMNEASYDIVFIDADAEHILDYFAHALRLVRPGGLVLVPGIFSNGKVADPVARDAVTTSYRDLVETVLSAEASGTATITPVGGGLLQLVTAKV